MSQKRLHATARIVRNSIALFAVAAMAKGVGLIIAIIVARYLGAETLGVYAVLMALTMLFEIVAPMGQQDVLVRAVARAPGSMLRFWIESSVTTFIFAALFSLCLAAGGRALSLEPDVMLAVDVVAISLPFGALSMVVQAVFQGLERMKFLTLATFFGRIGGLATLIVMLELGAGVYAAFVGRLVFHVLTLGILAVVLVGYARSSGAAPDWRLTPRYLAENTIAAFPFAGQRILAEAAIRSSVLVLPLLLTMHSVGLFDAADRIRQTIASIIPIVMLAIMPAFSRVFRDSRERAAELVTYTMKFLLIAIFPMAFLVAAASPAIIRLLYGSGYESSATVLQIVIWSQVFMAADMVFKQAMIGSDNEKAMLWRSAASVVLQLSLTVILTKLFGIHGAAAAIVAGAFLMAALDAWFVARHIVRIDFMATAAKPLLCAAIAGAVALALAKQNLLIVFAAAGIAYVGALFLLRAFSAGELLLMKNLPGHLLKNRR
ncbi:MAG: oligosaccharide flippase family protein [Woeseia sp.]